MAPAKEKYRNGSYEKSPAEVDKVLKESPQSHDTKILNRKREASNREGKRISLTS